MARKAKNRSRQPVIYPDSVRPPPVLPDAQSVRDMGFDLTDDELMTVRTAMAIHASSRQPKLLWTGWRQIEPRALHRLQARQTKKRRPDRYAALHPLVQRLPEEERPRLHQPQ